MKHDIDFWRWVFFHFDEDDDMNNDRRLGNLLGFMAGLLFAALLAGLLS